MTDWGLAGGIYGLILAVTALTQPIARRHVAVMATLAFALVSFGVGTLVSSFWVNLLVPGGLLLTGYWLSGLYFRDPQAWLEAWLLRGDHAVAAHRWMSWTPRPLAELLELAYAADHVLVGGAAIYVALTADLTALSYYWSLVVTSALASYVTIPWLRSRPPRIVEGQTGAPDGAPIETGGTAAASPGGPPMGGPYMRRLNVAILDTASIQANTLPSGHVAAAVAAALGVLAVDPMAGGALMIAAAAIAVAAIAGRYHYVVDCVAGAALPLLLRPLM